MLALLKCMQTYLEVKAFQSALVFIQFGAEMNNWIPKLYKLAQSRAFIATGVD